MKTDNNLYIQIKFLKNNGSSPQQIADKLSIKIGKVYHYLNLLTRENYQNEAKNVLYHSKEWLLMRELVLSRDGKKCTRCGATGTYRNALQVEHVLSKAFHPELAFDMSNLITLCAKCHKKTKTFARGAKKVGRKI